MNNVNSPTAAEMAKSKKLKTTDVITGKIVKMKKRMKKGANIK